jgi:hypothetical protein
MSEVAQAMLSEPVVQAGLRAAWEDSQPGASGGHEEGGFIVRESTGRLEVVRWPRGAENTINVPPHMGGKYGGKPIVASFHTHPNTGSDYLQEPSETDILAVQDDPDLGSSAYVGEFVISQEAIYLVHKSGSVSDLGRTSELLQDKDKP